VKPPTILIAGERGRLRKRIYQWFVNAENSPVVVEDSRQIRSIIDQVCPSIALCISANSSTQKGLKWLTKIRAIDTTVPVILIAEKSSESLAIAALRAGAIDYFKTPIQRGELISRCRQLISSRVPLVAETTKGDRPRAIDCSMIGNCDSMQALKSYIGRVAQTDSTVLITGETGTGKELAAESIHEQSHRCSKPMIRVNCSAMPDGLVESELFGHDRGAFTGAVAARPGKFELADGGILFLDEIGEMPPEAQSKILHCIENKVIFPLGAKEEVPLKVRVIAATNQDPEALIEDGRFREDLFYRLNVARIHLPPLRERREDIPDLIAHGIRKLNREFNRNVQGLKEDVAKLLLRYDWPGNVRELMNVLEGAYINMPAGRIEEADLPAYFKEKLNAVQHMPADERKRILSALLETNWNKSTAAAKLKWSRMTLYRKMTKYHIVENRRPVR
jgi:DNA-binding NtrC family response regulator